MRPDDKGELAMKLAVDMERKLIHLDFGTQVSWLAIGPDGARDIALGLLKAAARLDGVTLTVGFGDDEPLRVAGGG